MAAAPGATPEGIAAEGRPDPDKPILKGGGRQIVKVGDMSTADGDFDRLAPESVESRPNGVRIGRLADGRSIDRGEAVQRTHAGSAAGKAADLQDKVPIAMTIGPHVSNADASRLYERFRLHVSVEENVCAFFERDFLERRNWHAAAISEELTTAEAERLAIVCRRRNYRKAWALDINRLDTDFFFEIILDFKSLSMLEETFVTPSYLVVEEEERFMLVSDSDHYWEIAGPQAFLEDVLQKPLETVGREFMETTRNYRQGSSRIGGFLIRIADEATERSTPST